MNNKFTALVLLIPILLVSTTCGIGKKRIIIAGSSTDEALIQLIGQEFSKKHNKSIQYIPSGSLQGIKMLMDGKCEMVVSPLKISNEQAWDAQKKGIAIKEFIIAYDAMVIIVNKSNSVKNLFLGQISDMFTGLLKNWGNAGDFKGDITVVELSDNSGTQNIMHDRFFESSSIAKNNVIVKSHKAVVSYVGAHKTAIGYISRVFLDNTVKVLKINSFDPSDDNIAKGYYPLKREVYIYIKDKAYQGSVKEFIDMILAKNGQSLIKKSGLIPVQDITGNITK